MNKASQIVDLMPAVQPLSQLDCNASVRPLRIPAVPALRRLTLLAELLNTPLYNCVSLFIVLMSFLISALFTGILITRTGFVYEAVSPRYKILDVLQEQKHELFSQLFHTMHVFII